MKTTIRISINLWEKLYQHLFPGDEDEHGAVILAGYCKTPRGARLLVREVLLAQDGVDYVAGRKAYRELRAEFVARAARRCSKEGLCYFAVHCHGGNNSVGFSQDDLDSHNRGYPALVRMMEGRPIGALVFAKNAIAGAIWSKDGVENLDSMTVIGPNQNVLYPRPPQKDLRVDIIFDRQARIFGAEGQKKLTQSKIGIVGLGGAGSLINEWLTRLGVGEIVAVDPERLDPSNISRVVGSSWWQSMAWLLQSKHRLLRHFGQRLAWFKTTIAEQVAKKANPKITYKPIPHSVMTLAAAQELKDCDYLFLCADSHEARLMFNALIHQYLIPGVQVGSKVQVNAVSGMITDIFAVCRPVYPLAKGGCLLCNDLIDGVKLADEAAGKEALKHRRYVDDDDIPAPSVITLNSVCCSMAANYFLHSTHGLFTGDQEMNYQTYNCREQKLRKGQVRQDDNCLHCSSSRESVFARGDYATLPVKNEAYSWFSIRTKAGIQKYFSFLRS